MCKTCMNKCKAECCAWVPFNYNFLKKYESKMVRQVLCLAEHPNGRQVIPITHIEKRIVKGVEPDILRKAIKNVRFLLIKTSATYMKNVLKYVGSLAQPLNRTITLHVIIILVWTIHIRKMVRLKNV